MEIFIDATYPASGVRESARTAAVAGMFGVSLHGGVRRVLAPFVFTLRAGTVTFVTGASGAGKSTLLRCVEQKLRGMGVSPMSERSSILDALARANGRNLPVANHRQHADATVSVVRLEEIALPADRAVVDCFAVSLEETLGHLARAGLSEAHVLLRAPAELSEGQRFRYRLAQFFASDADVLIADEFAATLDRITARIVSWQLAKFVRASGKAAIVATTHDDLVSDLAPGMTIYKGLGDEIRMINTQ